MGLIGSFGPIIFMVSHQHTLTYSELEESTSGRWATHEPINDLPRSEFLGPGQDEAKLTIYLTPVLGTDPDVSWQILRALTRSGEHFPVILGGVPLNMADWYIDSIESSASHFNPPDGVILWREVTINIKEYN